MAQESSRAKRIRYFHKRLASFSNGSPPLVEEHCYLNKLKEEQPAVQRRCWKFSRVLSIYCKEQTSLFPFCFEKDVKTKDDQISRFRVELEGSVPHQYTFVSSITCCTQQADKKAGHAKRAMSTEQGDLLWIRDAWRAEVSKVFRAFGIDESLLAHLFDPRWECGAFKKA